MNSHKRGVSTLIASIFVIFLMVAMVSSLILIMNYWRKVTIDSLNKIELASQKTMESIKITQGPTATNTQIKLTIKNDGSTYVILLKYYVRDLQTNQVTYGNLNKYIPVSSQATITINGSFNPSDNYTIILISSRYKKYIYHYPPPPSPQTIKTAVLSNDHLVRAADDGTIAWAGVAKTSIINLTLTSNALYYNDFISNSSLNSLQIISGNWSWDPAEKALDQTNISIENNYGGEMIALTNVSPLSSNTIYEFFNTTINNVTLINSVRRRWVTIAYYSGRSEGIAYLNNDNFNISGLERNITILYWIWPFSNFTNSLVIKEYNGSWNLLNSSDNFGYQQNLWILMKYDPNSQKLYLFLYNSSGDLLSSTEANLVLSESVYFGLSTWGANASFDNLIITKNANPLYINVSGLEPNDKVIITDSEGNSFSALAGSDGIASIYVLNEPIIRNATVSLYYSNGSLIGSKTYPVLLGGSLLSYEGEIYEEYPILAVASGGYPYIDIYNLTTDSEGNLGIIFWKSIYTPGNLFNGSAYVTYDNSVTDSLLLINGSGVYSIDLLSGNIRKLSSSCNASASGVTAEAIKGELIVFPGEGSNKLCVLNLTDLTATGIDSLDNVIDTEYGASATDSSFFYAVARNSSSGVSKLIKYELGGNAPEIYSNSLPGYRAVGLAYGGGYLWLLLEGGSLYKIDPSTGDITHINVLGLPAPLGPGNRLVYYSGDLILVRATGSDEVWLLPTS